MCLYLEPGRWKNFHVNQTHTMTPGFHLISNHKFYFLRVRNIHIQMIFQYTIIKKLEKSPFNLKKSPYNSHYSPSIHKFCYPFLMTAVKSRGTKELMVINFYTNLTENQTWN